MNRTTARLFPRYGNAIADAPVTLRAIAAYAAQRPGLEFGNYCSGHRDQDGRRAYFAEARAITRDFSRVRDALHAAYYAGVTDRELIEASRSAFGGRLTINAGSVDYCTGQYWPTEYRKACAAVLEYAATLARRRAEAAKAAT